MVKKIGRLSSKARKLLEVARMKYSLNPEKANALLKSVDPQEWNMFDRQKIGREIRARENINPTVTGTSRDNARKYQVGYNIQHQRAKKVRGRKSHDYPRIVRLLDFSKEADRDVERAKRESDNGLYSLAFKSYKTAGRSYRASNKLDNALKCYSIVLDYIKNMNRYLPSEKTGDISANELVELGIEGYRRHVIVRSIKEYANENTILDIEKEIADLEKLKAEHRDRMKRSGLEKTAATASIVGILIGIFFLSPNLTGNVVGNLNQTSTNFIGVTLLLIGAIAGFSWFKKTGKKNNKTKMKKMRKKR